MRQPFRNWPDGRWLPGWLLALNGLALLLLASLLWPPAASWWREMDRDVFLLLNGTLGGEGWWPYLWARLNGSPTDTVSGLLMLALLVLAGPVFDAGQLRRGFLGFLCLLALGLLMRFGVHGLARLLEIGGPGPSLWAEPAIMLDARYPDFDIKDESEFSFPGDHASVLMLWALYVALFAPLRWAIAAALLAGFLSLPRLFAGAHGLSDLLVGSTAVLLLTFSWALCTPYLALASRRLVILLDPLTDWLAAHLPPLRWFAYFRYPAGESG